MKRSTRLILLAAWAVVVAAAVPAALWGAFEAYRLVVDRSRYVDAVVANVSADTVAVASANAGRISRLAVAPGAPVRAGSPLADVELPVPVRVTSGGTSVLSFSGTADQQVSVTAPVDGVVAALLAVEGSSVTAGQPLLRLVDPARIRVTAFVSEADVTRVHAGQSAEVTLTSTGDTVAGVVQAVLPPAATATAPVGTADGKVPTTATTYPVYVRVDLRDQVALLGTSAAVRIRVK